jgi:hypothetical protein
MRGEPRLRGNNRVPARKQIESPRDGAETGKCVEIVPLALGNLEVGIAVYFEDGVDLSSGFSD